MRSRQMLLGEPGPGHLDRRAQIDYARTCLSGVEPQQAAHREQLGIRAGDISRSFRQALLEHRQAGRSAVERELSRCQRTPSRAGDLVVVATEGQRGLGGLGLLMRFAAQDVDAA